jgi:hypothetical protein
LGGYVQKIADAMVDLIEVNLIVMVILTVIIMTSDSD